MASSNRSTPAENSRLSAMLLPRQKLLVNDQVFRILSAGAVRAKSVQVFSVEQLGASVGRKGKRLAEVHPELVLAAHGLQRDAVKIVRKLSRVVLESVGRGTE